MVEIVSDLTRLLRGEAAVPDDVFDRYLPRDLESVSERHWTPLRVVARAADWFHAYGVRSVVDIGSGAGKFCVAGALALDSTFTGLERRPRLVQAARRLAREFRVDHQVRFEEAIFGESAVPAADAYYLYNPFAENIHAPEDRIDQDIERGDWRFVHDVQATRHFLADLPTGTFVLTYHGFGGRLPHGFDSVCVDRTFSGELRMWEKRRKRR